MSIQWQRKDKGFWTCSLNATPFPHCLRAWENICGSYAHKIEQRLTEKENASVNLSGESSEGQTSGHRTFLQFFCMFEIFQHQIWEEERSLKYS